MVHITVDVYPRTDKVITEADHQEIEITEGTQKRKTGIIGTVSSKKNKIQVKAKQM